jgi:hypothetical protein
VGARVVVVHGIGQQLSGAESLRAKVVPPLLDGVALAAGGSDRASLAADQVVCAFYGNLFRSAGEVLSPEPYYDAADISDGFELDLLLQWWEHAAAIDDGVFPPGQEGLGRSPRLAQSAVRALSHSPFFSRVAERAFIGSLKQVHAYFTDQEIRAKIQAAVAACVSEHTRVMVGHSLGSVAAYEALAAHPEWPVRAFVSLGSPLGLRHLVFDRLNPAPRPDQAAVAGLRGIWPGHVASWTNIADRGDVVAVEQDLRPLFGDQVRQVLVRNGSKAHDMSPYLTEHHTGEAILAGLA